MRSHLSTVSPSFHLHLLFRRIQFAMPHLRFELYLLLLLLHHQTYRPTYGLYLYRHLLLYLPSYGQLLFLCLLKTLPRPSTGSVLHRKDARTSSRADRKGPISLGRMVAITRISALTGASTGANI
jgi:hypothetical protein